MAAFSTIALLALAGASTAISATSSIKAGNAAKRAGEKGRDVSESQAQLAEFNANIADLQADDAIARGMEEESRFRSGVRLLIGSQRAAIGSSGVDVNVGSAVDVQADAAYLGELDALTIRTNAGREAWGFQVQGQDLRKRAEIARREGVYLEQAGKEAQSASRWQAVGTIAGGAMDVGMMARRYGFGKGAA